MLSNLGSDSHHWFESFEELSVHHLLWIICTSKTCGINVDVSLLFCSSFALVVTNKVGRISRSFVFFFAFLPRCPWKLFFCSCCALLNYSFARLVFLLLLLVLWPLAMPREVYRILLFFLFSPCFVPVAWKIMGKKLTFCFLLVRHPCRKTSITMAKGLLHPFLFFLRLSLIARPIVLVTLWLQSCSKTAFPISWWKLSLG